MPYFDKIILFIIYQFFLMVVLFYLLKLWLDLINLIILINNLFVYFIYFL